MYFYFFKLAEFQKPLVPREFNPNAQQMMNMPSLPILPPYRNSLNNNSQNPQIRSSLMHNIVPTSHTASVSSSDIALNKSSVSLPQLAINSTMNSTSIIPSTIQSNSTLNTSIIPTTSINSKINSLISPVNPVTNSVQNRSSCTVTRSSINNLTRSPTIKNDNFNIQNNISNSLSNNLSNNNLLKPIQPTPMLPNNLNLLNVANATSNNLLNLNNNNPSTSRNIQVNGSQQNENQMLDHHLNTSSSPICMTTVLKENEIQKLKEAAVKVLEMFDRTSNASTNKKTKEKLKPKDIKEIGVRTLIDYYL